jgi:DNA-binding NarL/FixJ family response regulator
MAAAEISVLIADDHEIVRQAVADLLAGAPADTGFSYRVVGTATNGLEALAQVKSLQPQLLFLDVAMPLASGAEILVDIKRWSPETRVVVFTGVTAPGLLAGIIEQGVCGLFSKASPVEVIRAKLPQILRGAQVVADELVDLIEQAEAANSLTARERQVLAMIVAGKSNKEIASELFLSPKTVDKHRTSLMNKLEVHSVAQLMAKAVRDGLVVP